MKRPIWLCVATSILAVLSLPLFPGKEEHLIYLSGVSFSLGLLLFGIQLIKNWTRDPYSLTALQNLEDKEAIRRAEDYHDLTVERDIYCQCCGNSYRPEFKVCPFCKVRH